MTANWLIRLLVSCFCSIGIVGVLLALGEWPDVKNLFEQCSVMPVLLWAMMYVFLLILRTFRLKTLIPTCKFTTAFRAIGVQGGANRILPFRLGEVTLPYLIQQRESHATGRIIFALVWIRVLELFILVSMTLSALVINHFNMSYSTSISTAFLGLVLVVVLCLVVQPAQFARRAGLSMSRLSVHLGKIHPRLSVHWDKWCGQVSALKPLGVWQRVKILLLCICVQVCIIGLYAHILWVLGVKLSIFTITVGVSLAQLASLLPILTIGSVGLHESGWVSGFVAMGMGLQTAVSTGIFTQLITLLLGVITAGLIYPLDTRKLRW